MRFSPRPLLVLLVTLAVHGGVSGQTFTFNPNNLIVARFGGDANFGPGGSTLTSAATAVFLDQFLPNATGQTSPVNTAGGSLSIALPTAANGTQLALTDSGTATSNGYLSRTADGSALLVSGYNASVGTASVAGSNPATVSRTIGVVTASGVNTATGFNNGPSNNFRSLTAISPTDTIYASTGGSATTPGVLGRTVDNTVANASSIANGNTRVARIFANTLFVSSGAAAPGIGVSVVGAPGTLPGAGASATSVVTTGTSSTSSPYGFVFVSNPLNASNYQGTGLNTLYVADENTTNGGIKRYVFDGTAWNLTGNILAAASGSDAGTRGLTGSLDPTTNTVTLFATTTASSANRLVSVTDVLTSSGGAFGSFSTLATAPTNTVFRGVDFAPLTPVPEPAGVLAVTAAAVGAAGLVRRRVRRANSLASAAGGSDDMLSEK